MDEDLGFAEKFSKKIEFFNNHVIISLIILGIAGLLLRLYFLEELPITHDSLRYFQYSREMIVNGALPPVQLEIGWPLLTGLAFSVFHTDSMLDFMQLQRMLSIFVSVLTIIPAYLLGRRFVDKPYALMVAAFFVFEPHLVQNSIAGISEPLFLLLETTALFLFLSNRIPIVYASFAMVALLTITRSQGIVFFVLMSALFLLHNRKQKKNLLHYGIMLAVFLIILMPVVMARQNSLGHDTLVKSTSSSLSLVLSPDEDANNTKQNIVLSGGSTLIKQLGKAMIPYFGLFVPLGIILMLQKRNYTTATIISTLVATILVSAYILTFTKDFRYILWIFPHLCIISIFTVKRISEKIAFQNIFLLSIICGIVLLSGFFLFANDTNPINSDALEIAYFVQKNCQAINSGTLVAENLKAVFVLDDDFRKITTDSTSTKILTLYTSSVSEYITAGKSDGLTHLVVDEANSRIYPLDDAFYNPQKYPYLVEIYDSTDHNLKNYHVKIFKIDYEKFDLAVKQ